MGEIAEMMLDGTLCAGCGEVLGGPDSEPAGYPVYCGGCAPDYPDPEPSPKPFECSVCGKRFVDQNALNTHAHDKHDGAGAQPKTRVPCPHCGRRVKSVGLAQHMRDMHGESADA